jgi:glucan phosphoethanolaminetransferase (alkaline phosphatase superfamily)
MIQRKQSIWLLLAALLNAAVFLGANFSIETRIQNVLQTNRYTVLQHLPSTLFILAAIVLSLIAIFLFRKRPLQMKISLIALLATMAYCFINWMRIKEIFANNKMISNYSFGLASITPYFAIVFILLACLGIRKDEKLVKSLDRLR